MRNILNIFKIRKEERVLATVSTIVFLLLNILTVSKYYGTFSQITNHYHKTFVETFRVSGFDPLTYEVLSQWTPAYQVYRHPLLAFFMWPFNQINQGLMQLTGVNFATSVTAVILVVCSTYSCIFLFRIVKEIIGVSLVQAYALCGMYFGFAFVMLSTMVPDHFVMSMAALLLTLYISGRKLKSGSALNMWQTIVLFTVTAGISLNNGLKVFLAALVTRRKRFFQPGFLLLAVIVPSALIWGFAHWEYRTYVWPKEMAYKKKQREQDRANLAMVRQQVLDSIGSSDSVRVEKMVRDIRQANAVAKFRENRKKIWNRNTGKPIAKTGFMKWTDTTTPRLATCTENLFGEGIQLHDDYLLGDVLRNRPLIVHYRSVANYVVEAVILLLFLTGIWYGRKSLLLWSAMSFFIMDMVLHLGLGFGINEIYIMSPHYLFVIPIAIAFLLKGIVKSQRLTLSMNVILFSLTIWLWLWNASLITKYMVS